MSVPNRPGAAPVQPITRAAPWLWALAVLDMVAVAWTLAAGAWLDHASRLTTVMMLGGHHRLILVMAAVGFLMLAGLAALTRGFTVASRFHLVLLTAACMVSVVALAGALSVIVLILTAALVLGLVGRPLVRR